MVPYARGHGACMGGTVHGRSGVCRTIHDNPGLCVWYNVFGGCAVMFGMLWAASGLHGPAAVCAVSSAAYAAVLIRRESF